MKWQSLFITLIVFVILSCDSDDSSNFILEGKTYILTNFIVDLPIDLNNDDVFSNDWKQETDCFVNSILFSQDNTATNMFLTAFNANIENDNNQNPIQTFSCGIGDGLDFNYEVISNRIEFFTVFNDEIFDGPTGILSNNNETLTIEFSSENMFFQDFLLEDGTIVNQFQGDAIATYQLE